MSAHETTSFPLEERWVWDRAAEESVLGGLLIDNTAFDRVGDLLDAGDFFSKQHRTVYSVIASLINASKPADVVSVASILRLDGSTLEDIGGNEYLHALAVTVPSAAHVRRYAEIVRERSVTRSIATACDEAGTLVRQPGDATQKLDAITTMFARLERKQLRNVPRDISNLIVDRIDHYNELAEGAVEAGWSTRIPRLDDALMGGLRPGGLYILAARPSVGKSSLAEWIAIEMAKAGRPVLFLSLEMPSGEVVDRAVSNLGRVSYRSILTGKLDKDGREGEWSGVSEGVELLGKLPLWIDDQPAVTLQDIRLKAKACKGVKVLVLDYLQLCGSGRRDGNRNAEVEEISRGLKALAKELGIAVMALSQLNRDVEKRAIKRPQLADLRDSGAIEQDADAVFFLWPVREFEGDGRKIIGIGVDKNRQGRSGVEFGLDFYGDTQRWGESTADIRPAIRGRAEEL